MRPFLREIAGNGKNNFVLRAFAEPCWKTVISKKLTVVISATGNRHGWQPCRFTISYRRDKPMTMDEFQLYHEQTFDSFSKRVIKNIAIDILREEARLAKRETSLSALSAQDAARLSAEDTYELDEEVSMSLDLHGYPIQVHDPILGRALLALPPKRRDVVLLFYFADRNEPQIGRLLHLSTSAVSLRRKKALSALRELLEREYGA